MASNKFSSWRSAGTALLCSLLALPALAQQYGVVRGIGGLMVSEPSFFSAIIVAVPRGEKLEFVGRDGSFWKVRWNGKEGWMSRALIDKVDGETPATATAAGPTSPASPTAVPTPAASPVTTAAVAAPTQAVVTALPPLPAAAPVPSAPVAEPPPAQVAAAPVATPAPAPAPVAAATAPATITPVAAPAPVPIQVNAPAQTSTATGAPPRGRAVVFGISNYRPDRGIQTLPGVPRDMDSASAMAELMGIPADRISIYRDAELTKPALTAILTQLSKEIQDGEQVLVYFSGHGGRIADTSAPGRCVEGLITYDGFLLSSAEMSQLLQPLAKITDGLFVFFDACHSGGLSTTRAVLTGPQRFTAKYSAKAGDVSNCREIVNMLQSPAGTRATGNRYIYAAAARANEISLDDAENGGLATTHFLRCMAQGPSGSQTVDALRACAQAGIEKTLSGNPLFKPHHMTITGDLNIRPVRSELSPAMKQQLLSSATQGLLTNRPAAAKAAYVSSQLSTQGWPGVFNPQQAFAAITERTDAGNALLIDAPSTLKIDSQTLQMKVQAPADGYLYVFQATGDGKNAVMLFPNTADRDNRVKAKQSFELPRPSWPLVAGGPEGDNQLLVVFSKTERDLGQLVGQETGPFLDLAVSPTGMQALTLAVSRSAYADDADCKPGTASPPAYCAAGFSASVKTIREVR